MNNSFNKHIITVIIIGIVVVPIILNFLCLTVFPAPIVGDGKVWLGFWGSYLGGIITVLSTFFVLYKEHFRELNRKEYEIQKEHFESLCTDMGKLCSSINTDTLSFYLLKMKNRQDAISIMPQIGIINKNIRTEYNEFCLKNAHNGGIEKEKLINTFEGYANCISNIIDEIVKKEADRQNGIINEIKFFETISIECKKLEALGDTTKTLFLIAEEWKKKEWEKMEQLRLQYILN